MTRLSHADAVYERIAADILRRVAAGELRPVIVCHQFGRLLAWGVNLNTVARAYSSLAERGILETRAGAGTIVARMPAEVTVGGVDPVSQVRSERLRARLGSAVLEALAAGYSEAEIGGAVSVQLARWRATRTDAVGDARTGADTEPVTGERLLRLIGSHDLALQVLAGRLRGQPDSVTLDVVATDSLDGLISLARGTADLAGCHLLDPETGEYNVPFIRHLLPGEAVLLITLAHRQQGLIVGSGNPKQIEGIKDLTRAGVTFINRHRGSGTRVLFDDALTRAKITPTKIVGYDREAATHLAVASAVAAGAADTGLGILAAARTYGLDFIPVARERYELALRPLTVGQPAVQKLLTTLRSVDFQAVVTSLGGYDTSESGAIRSVD